MTKLTLQEKLKALEAIKKEEEKLKELKKAKLELKKGLSEEKQKKLYDLFCEYGGMKNIEYVAKRVGYTVKTAKSMLQKIRNKIAKEMALKNQDD